MIRDTLVRLFARMVIGGRWFIVPAWIAAAAASVMYLPGLAGGEPLALGGLVPKDAPAIRVGERASKLFSIPLTADTVVVQRDPNGLSAGAQARVVARAVAASTGPRKPEGIAFALPIANTLGIFPSSRERGTTALTFLFFGPWASIAERVQAANAYAARIGPDDALVGVTGPAPARYRQFQEIDHLELLEGVTVGVIVLVVGLTFRAVGAPLLTLFAAAVAFLVAGGAIPWAGKRLGVIVPEEVEPLVVALTLGIVTDYAAFYLAGYRRQWREGVGRVEAAGAATVHMTPWSLLRGSSSSPARPRSSSASSSSIAPSGSRSRPRSRSPWRSRSCPRRSPSPALGFSGPECRRGTSAEAVPATGPRPGASRWRASSAPCPCRSCSSSSAVGSSPWRLRDSRARSSASASSRASRWEPSSSGPPRPQVRALRRACSPPPSSLSRDRESPGATRLSFASRRSSRMSRAWPACSDRASRSAGRRATSSSPRTGARPATPSSSMPIHWTRRRSTTSAGSRTASRDCWPRPASAALGPAWRARQRSPRRRSRRSSGARCGSEPSSSP